jgi:hypothetical protein
MLGLIGKQRELTGVKQTVKNGKNTYVVCLHPYDLVEDVTPSAKYPDGKKVIPAASQDDFKRILAAVPECSRYIGELSPQQEADALKSMAASCAWYKKQNPPQTLQAEKPQNNITSDKSKS